MTTDFIEAVEREFFVRLDPRRPDVIEPLARQKFENVTGVVPLLRGRGGK